MLFLLFQLGDARYALDTAAVVEIMPGVALKPILRAPEGVVGLLDYHGRPVPVLDLCALATGQSAPARFSTRLILVRVPADAARSPSDRLVGLLAERATSILQRDPGDFQGSGLPTSASPYLGPVTADAAGFIHRVRVESLLGDPVRDLFAPALEERLP